MERLLLDVRSSLRGLRASPGLVATAVAALAMGIGFTTTMFSIVHGGTRSLPFDEPDELVMVTQTFPRAGIASLDTGPFAYHEWVARQESFEGLAAFRTAGINISGTDERPLREAGTYVTPNTFDLLGTGPALGRAFTMADARPGAEPVALIGHDLWRVRFGQDPDVLGATVRLNGVPHTIIGVMPPGFGFPVSSDLWIPFTPDVAAAPAEAENLRVFGRLRPDVPIRRASLEMETITDRLTRASEAMSGRSARVYPFVESEMDPAGTRVLYLLVAAVSSVLLMACANVANLLLARAATRTRDVAIRSALGASRRRIILGHLVESLALALAGGVIGLAIAHIGVGFFARSSAAIIDAFWVEFRVDPTVVAFASLLTASAAVLAGVMPAWRASAANVSEALKDRGGSSSLRIGRLSRGLVVTEIALACGLLVMTFVLTGSAIRMRAFQFPFGTRDVLTAGLALTESHTADAGSRDLLLSRIDREINAIPGVRTAALMSALPGRGAGNWLIRLDGEPDDAANRYTGVVSATPDFLDVLGGTVLRGRGLTWQDGPESPRVALVNESFVSRHSPERDPIGRTIHIGEPFLIVGVVPDLVVQDVEDANADGVYVPLSQLHAGRVYLVARTAGAPLALAGSALDAVAAVDPDLPVMEVATLHDAIYADKRILDAMGTLFFLFGAGALGLTMVGLYGVVSFAVNQRRREIGIRVALGAKRRDVFGLVVRQGSRQLLIGVAIGVPLAFGLSRAVGAGIEAIEPAGPLMLSAVVSCLAVTALVALVAPVRRALRVEPMAVLRDG